MATDHGQQAIGTLQVGERVLAYNPKTGKMEQEPILHVWINHDHDLVDLTITTTTKGEHGKPVTKTSEVVHTNQKHPFFTMEHGFLPVGQIKLGMHLLRADGRVGVVTGWKVVAGTKTMYNLEVAQDHTFTVGDGQWVVHNKCDPGDLATQVKNYDNFVKKYSSDTSWTLTRVDGPEGTVHPKDPAYNQRYYLHFTDWESYKLSISVDCNADCNVDLAHMHFSDDKYQESGIWTNGGWKRAGGDPGDPYANFTYP